MTTTFDREHRGFACAEEALDGGVLDVLVRRRSTRLAQLFLRCFRRPLEASSHGLDAVLAQLGEEPFEIAWSSGLGELRLALLTSPRDEHRALVAAVSLALHLAEKGRPVRFEIRLSRRETFRFGHHLLPPAAVFAFHSDGQTAVRIADDVHCWFTLVDGAWTSCATTSELVRVTTSGRPVVLLPGLPHATALPDDLVLSTQPHAELRASYEAAFAVLAHCTHPYRAWVERAIHAIVPIAARAGTFSSSSFEHFPGVIALSHDGPALALADALVHEASHQHFYMLTQLGPVHDGSDSTLYFSAARGVERPIDKILLAYHAFANILLFYRQCRSSGFGDSTFCASQERSYEACVADLRRPLESTTALTPLGRALFEPLALRVG